MLLKFVLQFQNLIETFIVYRIISLLICIFEIYHKASFKYNKIVNGI